MELCDCVMDLFVCFGFYKKTANHFALSICVWYFVNKLANSVSHIPTIFLIYVSQCNLL